MRALHLANVLAAVLLCACGDDDGTATTDTGPAPADTGPDATPPPSDARVDAPDRDSGPPDAGTSERLVSPGVFTFDGFERTLDPADLASLDALVADADIVGLGESIHTSGGYYQMKVRVIEHLVRDLGFRVVAFESPTAGAEVVDAYVQSCAGDPDVVVQSLHTIWWDRSVAELAEFLCEFNRSHASDPVHFMGFDNRQPWVDEPALRAWLLASVPSEAVALADGLSTCFGVGYTDESAFFMDPEVFAIFSNESMVPEDDHAACANGSMALRAFLDARRAELVAASSEEQLELMRLALVRIESFDTQAYHFFGRGQRTLGQTARDAAMADVLLSLRRLRYPAARVALWAHNYHVTRNSDTIEGTTPYRGGVNLGTLLDRTPGLRYVAIGLSAYDVGYDWLMGSGSYRQDSADSIERLLHDTGHPYLFVSFAEASVGGGTLLEPDGLFLVSDEGMIPREHYDGLLFLDVSPASTWVTDTSPFAMLPGG